MKRVFVFALLLACLSLCSCDINSESERAREYCFESKGISFTVGDDSERVVAALGNPNLKLSSVSCADEGMDVVYSYNGFKIYSHKRDMQGIITEIDITSDAIQTPEGIRIGDSTDRVLEKYGEGNYVNGAIEYIGRKCVLRFYMRDGRVSRIKYTENDR